MTGMRRWACWRGASATTVGIAVADLQPLGTGGFAFGQDSAAQATSEHLANYSAFARAVVAVGELDDFERTSAPASSVPKPDAAARARNVAVARSSAH